jgi:hypothetical protein
MSHFYRSTCIVIIATIRTQAILPVEVFKQILIGYCLWVLIKVHALIETRVSIVLHIAFVLNQTFDFYILLDLDGLICK